MKRDGHTCLDPETIAAFIDGKLAGAERARVLEHIADCADCYFVFSESSRAVAASAKETADDRRSFQAVSRWFARPRVMWSSLAGLAAAAALIVAVAGPWRSLGAAADLQSLVAAAGTERIVEPRLTGGFAYGPWRGAVRGEGSAVAVSPDVTIAAARIEKEAQKRRSQETLRALGVSYLMTGEAIRAVSVLEEAADQRAPDAQILSDLSAAYLVRAAQISQRQDLAKSLTLADRAVKANPNLAEAWYNRAIALERLELVTEARGAWRDYLKVDQQSGWATEARQHLQRLDAEVR
jgi:tetratricopeptide (TPR) repeat protein